MAQDMFMEVLVVSKAEFYAKFAKNALYALTVFCLIGSLLFGMFSLLLLGVATGLAAYFIGLRAFIEYEYSYIDKQLDIDIIYSKQKRKHLMTLDLDKMEIMAPLQSIHLDEYRRRDYKEFDYSSKRAEAQSNMYLLYYEGEKKIIFEPTKEMIDAIALIAPRKVFHD